VSAFDGAFVALPLVPVADAADPAPCRHPVIVIVWLWAFGFWSGGCAEGAADCAAAPTVTTAHSIDPTRMFRFILEPLLLFSGRAP
jgi:hypothetical protein